MPDRWTCPLCNHILPEDEWSRLPRTIVEGECGSHTEITCPECGFQTVGMAWVRVGWKPEQDRIASCEAGHERITPAPKDWTERAILVLPPDDSEPFFQECRTCPEQGIGLIQMMQGDDGVLHRVHRTTIFRCKAPGLGADRGRGGGGGLMLKSVLVAEEVDERLYELMEVTGCAKYPTGTLIIVRAVDSNSSFH